MNKGTQGFATSMELKFSSRLYEEDGSGDYSIKLLAWTIDVCGSSKDHREAVIIVKIGQMHVT